MINSFNNHTTQPSFASDSSTFPTPSKFFYVALSLYCIILSTLLMLAFTAFIGFINLQYENHISWQLVMYALLVVGGHAAVFDADCVLHDSCTKKMVAFFPGWPVSGIGNADDVADSLALDSSTP